MGKRGIAKINGKIDGYYKMGYSLNHRNLTNVFKTWHHYEIWTKLNYLIYFVESIWTDDRKLWYDDHSKPTDLQKHLRFQFHFDLPEFNCLKTYFDFNLALNREYVLWVCGAIRECSPKHCKIAQDEFHAARQSIDPFHLANSGGNEFANNAKSGLAQQAKWLYWIVLSLAKFHSKIQKLCYAFLNFPQTLLNCSELLPNF